MIILSLLWFFLIFRYAKKNFSAFLFMPSFIFAGILTASQFVYWWFCNFPVSNYIKIGGYTYVADSRVYLIHWCFVAVAFLSMYKLKDAKKRAPKRKLEIRQKIKAFFDRRLFPMNMRTLVTYSIAYILCFLMVVYHFTHINWDLLWQNNTYHLLKNTEDLNLSFLVGLIHVLSGVFAIFILCYMVLLAKSNRTILALGMLPFFLYFLSLKLAENSRWSALIVITAVPFVYKKNSIKATLSVWFFGITSFLFYLSAAAGRGGYYSQGIKPIFDNIKTGLAGISVFFPKIMATALSSGWNLYLSLYKFGNKNVSFDPSYKFLVYSPLLSSIDGYDDIKVQNILKIKAYAPVGFMGELYFFGPFFLFATLLFLWWAMRYCNRVVIKYDLIGMLCIAPLYLFFFKMQQYPIRNNFRYIVLALIGGYFLTKIREKKDRKRENKLKQEALLQQSALTVKEFI